MFASHSWPRWGNARIQEVMRAQRDAYAHLNNNVLHHANKGVTINEIHNVYTLPESLKQQWAAHSYHGSEEHNSRAVINRYLGYWDANPTTLTPLSPSDSAPLYVEMMGGAAPILDKAKGLIKAGQYLLATEILDKLVYAQPNNNTAKDLLADAFEQIGYQKESPSVRNSFLAAALELRSGIPSGSSPKTSGPDMIKAMSTQLWLDFLGIRLDPDQTAGKAFRINLNTRDNGERFAVELSNDALTSIQGYSGNAPDLTITVERDQLERLMTGSADFDQLVQEGVMQLDGSRAVADNLRSMLVQFTPDFEILPGTTPAGSNQGVDTNPAQPLRQVEPADTAGG